MLQSDLKLKLLCPMQIYSFLLLFLIPRGISKLYFIRLQRIPYRNTLISSTRTWCYGCNSPVRMNVLVRLNPEKLSSTDIPFGSVFDIPYTNAYLAYLRYSVASLGSASAALTNFSLYPVVSGFTQYQSTTS